jgi:hypothetical protein
MLRSDWRSHGSPAESPPDAERTTSMSIQSVRKTATSRFLIVLLALAPGPVFAAAPESSAETAPLDTHTKRYGSG